MRGILTIARRELGAYFFSPIGYIYLVAFLLFTNLLALYTIRAKSFFEFPVAEMREYFHVVAGVSAFLVAAITMRLWSEERKENTFEMLLTFPMRASELVLGKFLASLGFFLVALAGTLTVPLMMAWMSRGGAATGVLGLLDPGAVATGYLGAFLVGGLFLSFGLFVSGLCRDQIVAFVLSAPSLFFLYILGLDKVKNDLTSALAFLGKDTGEWIGKYIGIFVHYDNLVRGLVDGADLLFFVIWIAVFLTLNVWAIERRNRSGGGATFALGAVLLVAIGFAGNWLCADVSFGRLDATQDRVFTISDISQQTLRKLKEPVNVRFVVSPRHRLPAQCQALERDVRDKIDALRIASGNMIRFQVIQREAAQDLTEEADKEGAEDSVEKRVLKKIKPFSVEVSGIDETTAQLIYSGLEIAYRDKESEVISPLLPDNLAQLEYLLIKYVDKMTREKPAVVALVAPKSEPDPQMMMLFQQMGRGMPPADDPYEYLEQYLGRDNYEVRRIRLTQQEGIPPEAKVLAVIGPQKLNERQQYEIARALAGGVDVILAVQNSTFNYEAHDRGLAVSRQDEKPNVNRILGPNGVTVEEALVMDGKAATVQIPVMTMLGPIPQSFQLPLHPELKGDMFLADHPVLQRVDRFRYFWGSPLRLDRELLKKNGVKVTPLLQASATSWTRVLSGEQPRNEDIKPPRELPEERPVLAALLEGQFKNPIEAAPAWPQAPANPMEPPAPPEAEANPPAPLPAKPGRLLVLGNAASFSKRFIRWPELTLFLNAVSAFGMETDQQQIRRLQDKQFRMRTFDAGESALVWKILHIAGLYLAIAAAGVGVWVWRARRRERYWQEFGKR